jgi:diaminopimelate epimerase
VNVWERGSGITLACGTGACASAFISNQVKKLSNKLKVNLPGGSVTVSLDINEEIHLMGLVNSVYHGIYHYKED